MRTFSIFFAVLLGAVRVASADVTYQVTVNTSSISGTTGSLDFQFNPGPLVTQSASLRILNFRSDGTLAGACPCSKGDASGQLPATLTFDNGAAFNHYLDNFTFGTTISFDLSLYGPALSTPDGESTSGSSFVFSMFSDLAGTIPVLTSDTTHGFALRVDANLGGTTTVTNSSSEAAVTNPCDIKQNGSIGVADVQLIVNQALGVAGAVSDLNGDGLVNVVDVQVEIRAALALGCASQ
jgi:hypothetical protein